MNQYVPVHIFMTIIKTDLHTNTPNIIQKYKNSSRYVTAHSQMSELYSHASCSQNIGESNHAAEQKYVSTSLITKKATFTMYTLIKSLLTPSDYPSIKHPDLYKS